MVSQFRLFERLVEQENDKARVQAAERLVALDPLRESSQRILMQAYCDAGDNGLALKQYERCREHLRRELNAEPARETQDLRRNALAQVPGCWPVSSASDKGTVDPLYLSVLASLGQSATSNLMPSSAKGSIAVLPFINMSGDPEQEFFTDGLTEDLITDLSNVPGLFVIARNSTSAYKANRPTFARSPVILASDTSSKAARAALKRAADQRATERCGRNELHVWQSGFEQADDGHLRSSGRGDASRGPRHFRKARRRRYPGAVSPIKPRSL